VLLSSLTKNIDELVKSKTMTIYVEMTVKAIEAGENLPVQEG
jgi:hypothetical protein